MELHLYRYSSGLDDSLGLMMNGDDCTFMAYTLEDEYRITKVKHETRIPAGRYQIKLRAEGGFHKRYLDRFGKDFHKGMLCLFNAPNWKIQNAGMEFQYILIHCGNKESDTSGCILVGNTVTQNITGDGFVGSSTDAYKRVYPIIRDKLLAGEEVWFNVHDEIKVN